MAFAGTRTRGSACGCCENGECDICQASGDIPFCIRLTGILPDTDALNCAACDDLNTTFSGFGVFGGYLTLQECSNCELPDFYPSSLTGYRACYLAQHISFGSTTTITIAVLDCSVGSAPFYRGYAVAAALLKPNQSGMGTDTTELHVIIYRNDGYLHAKYEFASIPFDCSTVDWTEMDIVSNNSTSSPISGECDWTGVGIEFKFGGDCDVSGSPAEEVLCCEGTTLPGTLVLNGTLNGSSYWVDSTLTTTSPAAGYEYTAVDASVLQCDFDGGDPPPNWAGFFIPGEGTVTLAVLSCDPYHAVGSATFGANSYSVEITE